METVVEEIERLSGKEFYVTDDMVMLNRPRITRYMLDLCEKIKDFRVRMFLSCSPAMYNDPAFLDALAGAGATSMYTVFASDPFSQRFYKRDPWAWKRTVDLVRRLEDRGIRFFGSFGVGFDTMGEDQFFWTNNTGVEYGAIVRSVFGGALHSLTHFSVSAPRGTSTITQQVAKLFISDIDAAGHRHANKTMDRKLREMRLASALRKMYKPEEILEVYVNHCITSDNGLISLLVLKRVSH